MRLHVSDRPFEGEALKMMAAATNTQLEVITHPETSEFAKSVPFGDLPALEVDLQQYSQYPAILRYAAAQLGFVPHDLTQQLEADMIVSAIEGFGRSPKSMIPTLAPGEEEEKIGEGGRGGLGGLMRGINGLGMRRGGRGGRGGRGRRGRRGGAMGGGPTSEDSGGAGPMRRNKTRQGVNPMEGMRKNPLPNPFEMKTEITGLGSAMGGLVKGLGSGPKHRPVQKKGRDYLIAFTRMLENNLDGSSCLVGDRLTYADFALVAELRRHVTANTDFLRHFPTLQAWYNKICSTDGLLEYCKNVKR